MTLKFRKLRLAWCHCDISSPSSHHEQCMNKGCLKYIPNGWEVMSVVDKELKKAQSLLAESLDIVESWETSDSTLGDRMRKFLESENK